MQLLALDGRIAQLNLSIDTRRRAKWLNILRSLMCSVLLKLSIYRGPHTIPVHTLTIEAITPVHLAQVPPLVTRA